MDRFFALQNHRIKDQVLADENFPLLEKIIEKEREEYSRLKTLREMNRLDFGTHITEKKLETLVAEVIENVNDGLGLTKIYPPSFKYHDRLRVRRKDINSNDPELVDFSEYDPINRCMIFSRTKRAILIPTIAHEYTHHIEKETGIPVRDKIYRGFCEGLARGVQRRIANDYALDEKNSAFIYDVLDESLGELKYAYLWIAKKKDLEADLGLVDYETSKDWMHRRDFLREKISSHALGVAYFHLLEKINGPEVYNKIFETN